MSDKAIIQAYVHEIVTLNAEIAVLRQQLADALALAGGYRAEVEQVKEELAARIEDLAKKFGAMCYTCGQVLTQNEQEWDGDLVRCPTCYALHAWPVADFERIWETWQRTGSYEWMTAETKTLLNGRYLTWNEWCVLAHNGQGVMEDDE